MAAKPISGKQRMRYRVVLLAAAWCFGALLGWFYFRYSKENLVLLMRGAPGCAVSIVGSLLITAFPFVITGFAVARSRPQVLYFICFLKAFFYFTATLSVYSAFGRAGWLMQWLLLFGENISTVLLMIFWLGWLTEQLRRPMQCLGILGTAALCGRLLGQWIAFQILMKIV